MFNTLNLKLNQFLFIIDLIRKNIIGSDKLFIINHFLFDFFILK